MSRSLVVRLHFQWGLCKRTFWVGIGWPSGGFWLPWANMSGSDAVFGTRCPYLRQASYVISFWFSGEDDGAVADSWGVQDEILRASWAVREWELSTQKACPFTRWSISWEEKPRVLVRHLTASLRGHHRRPAQLVHLESGLPTPVSCPSCWDPGTHLLILCPRNWFNSHWKMSASLMPNGRKRQILWWEKRGVWESPGDESV